MPRIGIEPVQGSDLPRWTIEVDTPEINFLRSRYSHISDEEFNRTVRSATMILSQCPMPTGGSASRTGLAIGKVQSGKTLSFTTLIALAASNGYPIVVVLAGTKKALLNQTSDRLQKDLGVTNPDRPSRICAYPNPTIRNIDGVRNIILTDRCVLLVVLKNGASIRKATRLLSSSEIPPRPTLIIDDEGDEASLNNYFRQGEQSSTYQSILALRQVLPRHAYIAYTATPQANLLLDAIDALSPDFCELIEPGGGYCGGSTFFGDRTNNFVREIRDIAGSASEVESIPESLMDALAVFFLGAAVRHIRSGGQRHSMLIHMTNLTGGHESMTRSIRDLLRRWTDRFALRPNDPDRQELVERFRRAYDDLSTTVANPPSWEEVQSRLQRELQSYETHMVNSLPEGIPIAETTFQLENNIVIGGNILGRGVTIKDLTVSYMARRAENTTSVDTTEQRARWFGYKSEYLDLCRIYLPRRIMDDFQGILIHEDDFWDSLERNIRQGIPIREWPRFFRLDSGLDLLPTRASVARYHAFRPHNWETQRIPIPDPAKVDSNVEMINQFFESHNAQEEDVGTARHKFIRGCSVSDVIQNLLQRIDVSGTDWDKSYHIEYLIRLSVAGALQAMDVVLMSCGKWRERSLVEGNKINQLMEGSRTNKEHVVLYPGDSEIHNNRVQLQIHYITCLGDDRAKIQRTTALAFYVPEDSRFNISYIVREEPI